MSYIIRRHRSKGEWTMGLALLAFALGISSSSVAQAAPSAQGGGGSFAVYLASLAKYQPNLPPPTTFDLIDEALQQGAINSETALVYKAYAEFGDSRLPTVYRAASVGGEADLLMVQVANAYPTLSASTQSVLTPFFTPPFWGGSWASLATVEGTMSTPNDWTYLNAVGGKARIWYRTGNASRLHQATVIANALTGLIWTKESDLMGREPIPDGAGVQNIVLSDRFRNGWHGAFVPFSGNPAFTVGQSCDQTPSVIYVNQDLPDSGGPGEPGLEEVIAHEFMHTLQFAFPVQDHSCTEYTWLAEATATWAEEYVYHSHNTEWAVASSYLDLLNRPFTFPKYNRPYALYLLVYLHTAKRDDDDAVRRIWVNAARMDSYKAFSAVGGIGPDQLTALWNTKPFDTFLRDNDQLTARPMWSEGGTLTSPGGYRDYTFSWETYEVGSAEVTHFTIDPAVRTITILDGYHTTITRSAYNGQPDDQIFRQEVAPFTATVGAEFITMVKFAGQDEPWVQLQSQRLDFCQDWLKQRVTDIVIIRANNDLEHRNHVLAPTGEDARVLMSTVPCMGLQGTASVTFRSGNVVETTSATGLVLEPYFDPNTDPHVDLLSSDVINLHLTAGQLTWSISGTDPSGCTSSGSSTFSMTGELNPSNVNLYFDLLPGSRRYLSYDGTAYPDGGTEATYTRTCPGMPTDTATTSILPFFMADGTHRITPSGALQGSEVVSDGEGTTTWEWDLRPLIR